ncbi:MAG: hypothetical protein ABI488_14160 [Polyangiaceae bacterium]
MSFAAGPWLGGQAGRCLVGGSLAFSGTLFAQSVAAPTITPIELTMVGPDSVSVRVSGGTTLPCDSGDDRMLVQGKFNAGEVVRASTTAGCVCVQQTYQPFPDIDWTPAGVVCRPQACRGVGRTRRCVPAKDPTIRLRFQSQRPE